MVKWISISFAVLLLLAAGGWYFGYYKSDAAVIRRTVEGFRETLEKDGEAGNIAEVVRNQTLGNYIAPEIVVDGTYKGIDGTYSRSEFASEIFRGSSLCRVIKLDFSHMDVTVPEYGIGYALFEATGFVETKSGKTATESRDVTMGFIKIDGNWYISRISAEPMLQ